ncbi:MAG: helix-turn-helix transcriptional regulator [Clostridia bacterium]|nr:helix-turn-helix transcriptional regulator [Clostridia bacterium]
MKLGERIRELRQRDGRTQEALAGELGVTAQAVSRWENGICCPDVELIPSIASYFSVSIDELFGYERDRAKKAEALYERIIGMIRENNGINISMDACVALAREAVIEFPGHEKLTFALASALYNAGYVRYGEHHIEDAEGYSVYDTARHRAYHEWQEAMRLFEKLLETLKAGPLRREAVQKLSQLYKNLGEREKALTLAEAAPGFNESGAMLRINAFDGREELTACGEALLQAVHCASGLMQRMVMTDLHLFPEDAAELLDNAAEMFRLVCTDGCYGKSSEWLAGLQLLRSYYLWLAGEKDTAFEALDSALAHAQTFDRLRDESPECFTSPLLRHVKIHAETLPEGLNFSAELPEVWPWWCVPRRGEVRAEMENDPRWKAWADRAAGQPG